VRLVLLLSLTVLAASCSRVVSPGTSNASTDIGSLPRRGLTPGERAMIAPIFGDSIDYDTVRIIHARHPFQASNMYMAPRGHIYAPGDLWHDDWAGFGVSAVARAEFVHEMTHVWQYVNGMNVMAESLAELLSHRGDYERAYQYLLEDGRDLADYGVEQQAAIIEDYYRITIENIGPTMMVNTGLTRRERLRLYRRVLARMFDDPQYVRLAAR